MRENAEGLSRHRKVILFADLAMLVALGVLSWSFASSSLLREQQRLVGYAIFLDLTVTAPVCHWLIGVRRGGMPGWTLIPLVASGIAISHLLLPVSRGPFPLIALALAEGAVLVLMVVRIRVLVRAYRVARRSGAEPFDALEAGVLAIAPSAPGIAAWVRLELQLWTLLVFGWFFRPTPEDSPTVFTHHRDAGWFGFLAVICFVLALEGVLVHVWLHSSGYSVAKWVVFALHLYTFAWLIGDAQALRLYRSSLRKQGEEWFFFLSLGLRQRARIPLSYITEVTTGSFEEPRKDELLAVVQGAANVRLVFRSPTLVRPMLGTPRATQRLLLQVDEPAAFRAALTALLAARDAAEPTR
jgi:hypothetical protein